MTVLEICVALLQVVSQANDTRALADLRDGKLVGDDLIKMGQRCNEPIISSAFASAFRSEMDFDRKRSIASVLVRYRSNNTEYFEYLQQHALQAVNSDAPVLYKLDSAGNAVRGERNPQFERWCQARKVDVLIESGRQLIEYPSTLSSLAFGVDRRSIPIFLKGLESKNPLIIMKSATGLAELGDVDSIPAILHANGRSAVRIDGLIANALTKFANSEAYIRLQLKGSQLLSLYNKALKYRIEGQRREFPAPPTK